MKLVLDTNVLIAGFISRGVCAELIEHVIQRHEPVTSDFILDEFKRTLTAKFKITQRDASAARQLLASRFTIVVPTELGVPVCRDSDDVRVIGTALAGDCACIVTGDRDLLDLKRYRKVAMVSPQQFWKFEAEHRGRA